MASNVTLTPGADVNSIRNAYFVFDFIYILAHSPTIDAGSTTATATVVLTSDDGNGGTIETDSIVTFHGTSLNTDGGVITGMDVSFVQNGVTYQEQAATGFNISSGDMLDAINAADNGDTGDLKAIFAGINWTLDASGEKAKDQLLFQGTGGDDVVTLGKGNDQLGLDGGNDKIDLGAGNDTISLVNSLGYSSPGLSKIDGGDGQDTLVLNDTDKDSLPIIQHGLKIDMNKTIKLDDFSVKLKHVEGIVGTAFTDTITGTSHADAIDGGGGGDRIIGGGGADTLISEAGVDDFFTYTKATDSGPGKAADTILGFEHGVDVIDLHKLSPADKDHEFHFVGDHELKKAGDLAVVFHNEPGTEHDYYMVEANLDNDKAPELEIKFDSMAHITKADFLL